MRKLTRRDLDDFQTYEDHRSEEQVRIFRIKAPRRIHVGEVLTFLFENTDTVRYQVQEMMRAERIVREADIQHEIDTYNELLGGPGELGATLLVELEDEATRPETLRRWIALPRHVYVRLEGGEKVYASFDPRQVGEDRLSAVQYLKFATGGRVPIAAGADHPDVTAETTLTAAQRQALAEDLEED